MRRAWRRDFEPVRALVMPQAENRKPAKTAGEKSAEAFRTISEVAAELDLPQHVLRFWESKFPHVRPLKRGGGRRYYRPEDIRLLRRIRDLLYREGYTIRGVQKLLRENGARLLNADAAPALGSLGEEGTPIAAADRAPPAATVAAVKAEERRIDAGARAEIEGAIAELMALRALLDKARG